MTDKSVIPLVMVTKYDPRISGDIQDTLSMNRSAMLQHTKMTDKSVISLVMVTKYNPRIRGLKRKLLKHWNIISKDKYCKNVFKNEPILAYKKHKNITDMLISSRIRN